MAIAGSLRILRLGLLTALALLIPQAALAQWASEPGETKRNGFGPLRGEKASICRGACGAGCPETCFADILYECVAAERLRRVETYECGTHRGCREHDDCLDACSEKGVEQLECKTRCHQEAVEAHGFEDSTSWARGGGPYDSASVTFEYTIDGPGSLEPAYRCPEGANRSCEGQTGSCVAADGSTVAPVFDGYPSAGANGMRVAGFRAGRLCGGRVCEQTDEILVNGEDSCTRHGAPASCTRYGVEFDYRNADPSEPLRCSTSTSGGESDFIGDLVVKGLGAMPEGEESPGEEEHGMSVLLGVFKKVVTSAERPEDVRVTMAPLDENGKPIESQRVGTPPDAGPPSAPTVVAIDAAIGHLVVPMYEYAGKRGAESIFREIRCSHKGVPVFETEFRLSF